MKSDPTSSNQGRNFGIAWWGVHAKNSYASYSVLHQYKRSSIEETYDVVLGSSPQIPRTYLR